MPLPLYAKEVLLSASKSCVVCPSGVSFDSSCLVTLSVCYVQMCAYLHEHSTFTPLVMNDPHSHMHFLYSRLASMIKGIPYHQVMGWICCELSFTLHAPHFHPIRIRGSRNTPEDHLHAHRQYVCTSRLLRCYIVCMH